MKKIILTALLAFVAFATARCTYTPTDLHPLSGNEELEIFKDSSPD